MSVRSLPNVFFWFEIWWLWRPLDTVHSLSCSRNQSEMIWALWHGWTWSAAILKKALAFKHTAFKQCSYINKAFLSTQLLLTEYDLFLDNREMVLRDNPSISAVSEILRPACPPTTMPPSKSLTVTPTYSEISIHLPSAKRVEDTYHRRQESSFPVWGHLT